MTRPNQAMGCARCPQIVTVSGTDLCPKCVRELVEENTQLRREVTLMVEALQRIHDATNNMKYRRGRFASEETIDEPPAETMTEAMDRIRNLTTKYTERFKDLPACTKYAGKLVKRVKVRHESG